MPGPVLYLHVNRDGGIFSVRADGSQGWVSEGDLDRLLYDLSIAGGSVLYSVDDQPDLTPIAASTLRHLTTTGVPNRRLPQAHPAVAAGMPAGTTTMMLFAHRGEKELLVDLLDRGSPTDERDHAGTTALMFAASAGHSDIVRLLVDRGAQVDLADDAGVTALMYAAERGHATVVRILVDAGADLGRRSAEGLTALGAARAGGHSKVVTLIARLGGTP
ncbi:MAG: ankyrin repeat domain-containing protein [Actinobacteria bacterium]|nr:ankyrin repeat domain-containing protein [Actinomycetota bacterium]